MQTISHGIPAHSYFTIAQPPTPGSYSEKVGSKFVIQNPRNENEKHNVELVDMWNLQVKDVPNTMCLLSYGLPKNKLMPALYKQYPLIEKTQKIHFYLLRKLD